MNKLIRNKKLFFLILFLNLMGVSLLALFSKEECYECVFYKTDYSQRVVWIGIWGTKAKVLDKARSMCLHFSPNFNNCNVKSCQRIMCHEKAR